MNFDAFIFKSRDCMDNDEANMTCLYASLNWGYGENNYIPTYSSENEN